jgi:hypothetical protein
MVIEQLQAKSELPKKKGRSQDNILVLNYSPDLNQRLAQLLDKKHLYDAILIDASDCGFLFMAEMLVESARLAKNLLEMQGTLIFLNREQAVGLCRESLVGNLAFLMFDNYAQLFDYSPALARHVQVALGKSANVLEESTDIFQQVLMSTIPVLTRDGIKMKGTIDRMSSRNTLLASIDNFTPLSSIAHRIVSEQQRMTMADMLQELKGLESSKVIYPIFAKIPFLINCFQHKTPFTLRDYLVAAKYVNQSQLDEMLVELKHTFSKEQISLGPLALKKGYINSRQLEITMQDQAFYGRHSNTEQVKVVKTTAEESQVHSLIGRLGTTHPSNLLQNLAQNRETGVLSVEYKDLQFRAQFELGKLTHAKLGKITGNSAIIEFASAWLEGIFVFIQRTPPPDLAKEACMLNQSLDKLLLDAALAKDKSDLVLQQLPNGKESLLEKVPENEKVLDQPGLEDPQDKVPLKPAEIALMKRLFKELDGLGPLGNAIRRLGDVTTYDGLKAAERLWHYKLLTLPDVDVHGPLDKFRQLCRKVVEKIGAERSMAFLRLSLRDTMSYSARARMFAVGRSGEVGIDMAIARQAGASLSVVIKDIEDWQVKYIEYVSQEVDSELLLSIIQEIHQQ